ncbi:MAG: hypothetical protein V2I63_10170 [Pseudomonadales bacterium]|nr:hypothetical protein [Pseudomonadales bacterium]
MSRSLWRNGPARFVPFATMLVAILLTDLQIGVFVGLLVGVVSRAFIVIQVRRCGTRPA